MYSVKIKNGFVTQSCCLTCEYYPGDRCIKNFCGELCIYTDDPTYPARTCLKSREFKPGTSPCLFYREWSGR